MKTLITLAMGLLLPFFVITQNFVLEEFNSFDGVGEWTSPTNTPNAGSHSGLLCYNIDGNYANGEWMFFESPLFDFSTWTQLDVIWHQECDIRGGDEFRLYYYDGATGSWYYYNLTNLTGTYMVTLPITTRVVSFDLLSNGNGNLNNKYAHVDYIRFEEPNPLPVELLFFEGENNNKSNILKWATASENNSSHFDIQHSENGDKWTTLNTVTSVGNSTEYTEYIIWDVNYQPIINYYQLIQYDFDGEFETFGPIAIDNRTLEQRIIKYTNLLGQEINPLNVKGIIIETYEDGSIRKVFRP
tara:strand:+ start:1460 stop:2359 length:900 start_codon:yes stop_codon:yes gene_type:complete